MALPSAATPVINTFSSTREASFLAIYLFILVIKTPRAPLSPQKYNIFGKLLPLLLAPVPVFSFGEDFFFNNR
jgi:hypothetical protein